MGAPHQKGLVGRVVIPVVILRNFYGESFSHITFVLSVQCDPVIFRMSHDEDLAAAVRHGQENSGLFGFRQDRQFTAGVDVRRRDFRMSGVRRQKHIVKSSHQRDLAVHHLMPEKTEHFLIQRFLLKPVEMIQGRLGGPAEKDRGGHMRIRPVHDLRQLLPVIHFLEFHLFHRGRR